MPVDYEAKLGELAALKEGWDSYGASRIFPHVIDRARKVLRYVEEIAPFALPAIWIIPTCIGGIQLEWHDYAMDVETEFFPEGGISTYAYFRTDGYEQDLDESEAHRSLRLFYDAVLRVHARAEIVMRPDDYPG